MGKKLEGIFFGQYMDQPEGIDGHQDRPNIGVDVAGVEPLPQVVQEGLLRQFRQHTQIRVFPVYRLGQELGQEGIDSAGRFCRPETGAPSRTPRASVAEDEAVFGGGLISFGQSTPDELYRDGVLPSVESPLLAFQLKRG